MRRLFIGLCLVVLLSTLASAADVGLRVVGNAGFAFKPAGSSQFFLNATPYDYGSYNQASYSVLTGETSGTWNEYWSAQTNYATYEGKAQSKAKADFGSLGVYSSAWVSEKDAQPNSPGNYWDWSTGASAFASFADVWKVNAQGLAGQAGSLSVVINLEGDRTNSWDNHVSSLGLVLRNFTNQGRDQLTDNGSLGAGSYMLTIPFLFGVDNNVQMEMSAGCGSFNENLGGGVESYLDFYDTAMISGMTFRDAQGNIITDYTMITSSGHDYLPNSSTVPEPFTLLLLGLGLAGVFGARKKFKK